MASNGEDLLSSSPLFHPSSSLPLDFSNNNSNNNNNGHFDTSIIISQQPIIDLNGPVLSQSPLPNYPVESVNNNNVINNEDKNNNEVIPEANTEMVAPTTLTTEYDY